MASMISTGRKFPYIALKEKVADVESSATRHFD